MQASLSEMASFLETGSDFPPFSSDSLEALYGTAFELYRNGKYEDAADVFRFLTLSNSFERKYWIGLAACHQMNKHYAEAIECYSIAAIQDPTDPYAHLHAAECFFHMGQKTKAKEALASAAATAKDSPVHAALMPKLELLHAVWSNIPVGGSHD